MRTGCQWRYLPHEVPNWKSMYAHDRKWSLDGTWERVNRWLVYERRRQAGRLPYPSAGSMDSQRVKTTESDGERGFDSFKKIKGCKRYLLADTPGNLLKVVVHAAHRFGLERGQWVLDGLTPMLKRSLPKLWADGAYKDIVGWCYQQVAILLEIVSQLSNQKGFQGLSRC